MKLMVATKEIQGKRKNDFCWAIDNEIVTFGSECDGESIDGGCGCRRSMSGIDSCKATTTMKVIELNITQDELYNQLFKSKKAGWGSVMTDKELEKDVKLDMKGIFEVASAFNIGDIVEKRGNKFQQRQV